MLTALGVNRKLLKRLENLMNIKILKGFHFFTQMNNGDQKN